MRPVARYRRLASVVFCIRDKCRRSIFSHFILMLNMPASVIWQQPLMLRTRNVCRYWWQTVFKSSSFPNVHASNERFMTFGHRKTIFSMRCVDGSSIFENDKTRTKFPAIGDGTNLSGQLQVFRGELSIAESASTTIDLRPPLLEMVCTTLSRTSK
ncbi:hypothetical protein BJ742DRAFT_807097 [Cladochytrium replicatum]|nr:hypothetical protein BJ742DRAFT_807097 [Cladochytrium replicatum]